MAIVFKTPKSTLNTTSKQIQNLGGDCPPCPEPVLEGKELEYTQNGEYTVTPEQGVDGFSSIDVTVNVPSDINNQNKSVTITENGTSTVSADSGYSGLGDVTVEVNVVPTMAIAHIDPSTEHQTITPPAIYDGYASIEVNAVTNLIDSNIAAGNIKDGVTILGVTGNYSGSVINNQNKTVSPSTSQQSVSADQGYTGLGTVTVNAVTSSIDQNIAAGNIKNGVSILGVTGTYNPIPDLQAKTVNPSTSQQTVTPDQGKDGLSSVTVNAVTAAIDANIQAENILDGITILGVTGTDAGYDVGYSDGYAEGQAECQGGCENTVLVEEYITTNGTYAYDPADYQGGSYDAFNGVQISVAVPDPELQDKTVTPTTSQQEIDADAGYDGLNTVTVNAVTSAIDQNIVAGNIRDGVTILGVIGTYTGGPVTGDKFWIKSLEDGNQISIHYNTSSMRTTSPFDIHYSLDGTTWTTATPEKDQPVTINVDTDDVVYFKGDNTTLYTIFDNLGGILFRSTKTVDMGGYLCSLLDSNNYVDYTFVEGSAFKTLFGSGSVSDSTMKVVDASQLILPKSTSPSCYYNLFGNCSTLEVAPSLPATNVATEAYKAMFKNCSSLRAVPAMSFKVVEQEGCNNMFAGCTSITSIPVINLNSLSSGCFAYMFDGCTGITSIPAGSVYGSNRQIAPNQCCMQMFGGCTSLQTVPQNLLPCERVYQQCYDSMFKGCTNLLNAPDLPGNVGSLGNTSTKCYEFMFENCRSLTTAPALPSTSTYNYCYNGMFLNCTSLTTAPVLPATSVMSYAYQSMFSGCYILSEITCLATSLSTNATSNWVNSVAATGTFYKNADMSNWTTGNAGIPSGWTVEDYVSA